MKRLADYKESNQAITMGLMEKINTDGLSIVIDNMKNAQIDISSFNELLRVLTLINENIQNQSLIPIEQIQKQLGLPFAISSSESHISLSFLF